MLYPAELRALIFFDAIGDAVRNSPANTYPTFNLIFHAGPSALTAKRFPLETGPGADRYTLFCGATNGLLPDEHCNTPPTGQAIPAAA